MEIDLCYRKMYLAPLWIDAAEAKVIAGHGLQFLEIYQALATQASREGRALFLYNSKIHMNDHIFRNLAWEAEMAPVALNPMTWGVQLDEDLIGKASRLTRHVSSKPAFTIKRTLQRWLIASFAAWSKAGMLERIWSSRKDCVGIGGDVCAIVCVCTHVILAELIL